MFYRLLRTLLFQLDAEKVHHLGLVGIKALKRRAYRRYYIPQQRQLLLK